MDQNSVFIESMSSKPAVGNFEKPSETSVSTTDGQRSFMPDVSNLMTWVSQITSQHFELLKMARSPGNDIGMG